MKINKKPKLLIVARDTVNTGGGHVIEQLVKYFKESSEVDKIILFTDYKNPFIEKLGVLQITMPFGEKLKRMSPKSKIGRIIRHFVQIFLFSISSFYLKNSKFKEFIIIDSNNEGFVCDISLTHDVFSWTYLKDVRKNTFKFLRIFNPVLFFKIFKEIIVLNKPSTRAIIAISNETKKEVESICKKNITKYVIGHGVDTKKFCPCPDNRLKIKLKNKFGIPAESFVLLLSGHEYERKGLEFVIKALSFLSNDIHLVVTGTGDIKPYLSLVYELGLNDRVHFLGLIDNIVEAYWISDIFVLPSSYEGWGLVATEAMGCGLPVLITKVGGVQEYLVDFYNGIYIKRDEMDIVEKVEMLKKDNNIYKEIAKNALKTAERYSWKNTYKKYLCVIKKVQELKNV